MRMEEKAGGKLFWKKVFPLHPFSKNLKKRLADRRNAASFFDASSSGRGVGRGSS
jgi:hypothetical protein